MLQENQVGMIRRTLRNPAASSFRPFHMWSRNRQWIACWKRVLQRFIEEPLAAFDAIGLVLDCCRVSKTISVFVRAHDGLSSLRGDKDQRWQANGKECSEYPALDLVFPGQGICRTLNSHVSFLSELSVHVISGKTPQVASKVLTVTADSAVCSTDGRRLRT